MTLEAELKAELLRISPELEAVAAECRQFFGPDYDPSPMVFFDDVLDPYLATALESGTRDPECRALFAFFERLANHRDEQAVLCVSYSLSRALQGHPSALSRANAFMGPRTRKLVQDYLLAWTTWSPSDLPWRAV